MADVNPVGDVVLTDPAAMRALAHPARLALLDLLRRAGQASAGDLAARTDEPSEAVMAHLRELEPFGLVEREGETWQAVGKGVYFDIPDDPEGAAAARQLGNAMYLRYADLPRRWVADDEPRLEMDWARAAGLFNARLTVTPEELRGIQDQLEVLLEPYLVREPAQAPERARQVRILSYFMPEPPVG